MKIDKNVADIVIAPNQKNTRKSSGPKTGAGKGRAAMNGLFTEELQIGEEDRPEFETVRDRVSQQFPPATPMRQLASERIVCCSWRCKRALRMENLAVDLQQSSDEEPKVEAAGGGTILTEEWYGADFRSRQNGLRFLRELRADAASGYLHLEQEGHRKASLIKGFGINLYNRLMEWDGMSPWAIRGAEHMEHMLKTYKMKPPSADFLGDCSEHWAARSETAGLKPPPTDPSRRGLEDLQPPKVVPDPKLLWQMRVKLIDFAIEHLEAIDKIMRKQGSREAPQTLAEFSPRYFADASRDLQRAVDWYLKLKARGL